MSANRSSGTPGRVEHGQHGAVGTAATTAICAASSADAEEVGRVEADPEVEERVGARFVAGEVDGARDETGPDADDEARNHTGSRSKPTSSTAATPYAQPASARIPTLVRLRRWRQRQRDQPDGRALRRRPSRGRAPSRPGPVPGPDRPRLPQPRRCRSRGRIALTIGRQVAARKPFLGTGSPGRGASAVTGWFSRRNDNGGSCEHNGNTGPPGQPRGIGFGILLYVVTLGLLRLVLGVQDAGRDEAPYRRRRRRRARPRDLDPADGRSARSSSRPRSGRCTSAPAGRRR